MGVNFSYGHVILMFKGLACEGAKVVPLFIRFLNPADAIWSRDCHNEVIISSLHGVIKRPLKDNTCSTTDYWFMVPA